MPKSAKKILSAAVALLIVMLAIVVILDIFNENDISKTKQGFAMGSFVTATVYGGSESASQKALDAISSLENNGISAKTASSFVSKINQNAGISPVECDDATYNAIALSLELAKKTDGAFNPLIGALSRLWDFDDNSHTVPSKAEIDDARQLCDFSDIIISENKSVFLNNSGERLDLGGMGKGLACDTAYKAFASCDCDAGIIIVGGSIGVYGNQPSGKLWSIAVRDPFKKESSEYIGYLAVPGGTFISTSGDYQKSFEKDGIYYHHILDSKTGYPADSILTSVTVVADNGALSDILSTACFVLGYEKSKDILNEYGATALFVFKDSTIKTIGEIKFERA